VSAARVPMMLRSLYGLCKNTLPVGSSSISVARYADVAMIWTGGHRCLTAWASFTPSISKPPRSTKPWPRVGSAFFIVFNRITLRLLIQSSAALHRRCERDDGASFVSSAGSLLFRRFSMRDLRVRWHIRRERNNSQSPMEAEGCAVIHGP
jgi:hypothetical protein